MSIRSMTGYGQGSGEIPGLKVTVELRAVNNRFADVRARLPQGLGRWESEIRRQIQDGIRRGRVDVTLRVEQGSEGAPDTAALNRTLVEQVLAARDLLRAEFQIDGDIGLADLVRIPGMFQARDPDLEWNEEQRGALEAGLSAALAGLDQDRLREGENLRRELVGRLASMVGLTGQVRRLAAALPTLLRTRLEERLKGLADEVELDPARIAQEAVLLADRSDVTEEVVRLEGHLQQAQKLLTEPDGEPVGKRMEFLLQEILRETNTVNSKSPDLELSRTALALKADCEKVREQVLNLV